MILNNFIYRALKYISFIFLIFTVENELHSQVNPAWQVSYNDSLTESNYAVKSKTDSQDNVIIIAEGYNSSLGTSEDIVLIKYNSSGKKLWVRRFNGSGNGSDYPKDLVIDRNNNIYVTGSSWSETVKNDYTTLKYSPKGELLWAQKLDWLANRNDGAYSMCLDSNNNVYVTGLATVAFNGHELYDMVTVKYNSDGEQKWVNTFSGFNDIADWGYSIVSDPSGNVYVSGFTLSATYINHDIITIKYDSTGNEIWQKRFNHRGTDYIRPLFSKLDRLNNLIVLSYYQNNTSQMDYLVYKYDSSGELLWSNIFDGELKNDWVADLTIDKDINIYVSGSCYYNRASYDYVLVKYSESGQELWHSRVNDSIKVTGYSNDQASSVIIDQSGNVLVHGSSSFNQGYSCVMFFNSNGILLTKFRNFWINNSISINLLSKNDFIIMGVNYPKTVTSRYQNFITNLNSFKTFETETYILYQNFPNPFNPKTFIKYQISKKGYISLKVYNSLGKEINSLVNEIKSPGIYEINFEGLNLSSGIYFYSLQIDGNLIDTKRMVYLK